MITIFKTKLSQYKNPKKTKSFANMNEEAEIDFPFEIKMQKLNQKKKN